MDNMVSHENNQPETDVILLPQSDTNAVEDSKDIKEKLKRQFSFYFSRENLLFDQFMKTTLAEHGFISVKTLKQFPAVLNISQDEDLIIQALQETDHVTVDVEKMEVRVMSYRCALMLRNVDEQSTEADVRELFNFSDSSDGHQSTPLIKQIEKAYGDCWYVTFETEDSARSAMQQLIMSDKLLKDKKVEARLKEKPLSRDMDKFPRGPPRSMPGAISGPSSAAVAISPIGTGATVGPSNPPLSGGPGTLAPIYDGPPYFIGQQPPAAAPAAVPPINSFLPQSAYPIRVGVPTSTAYEVASSSGPAAPVAPAPTEEPTAPAVQSSSNVTVPAPPQPLLPAAPLPPPPPSGTFIQHNNETAFFQPPLNPSGYIFPNNQLLHPFSQRFPVIMPPFYQPFPPSVQFVQPQQAQQQQLVNQRKPKKEAQPTGGFPNNNGNVRLPQNAMSTSAGASTGLDDSHGSTSSINAPGPGPHFGPSHFLQPDFSSTRPPILMPGAPPLPAILLPGQSSYSQLHPQHLPLAQPPFSSYFSTAPQLLHHGPAPSGSVSASGPTPTHALGTSTAVAGGPSVPGHGNTVQTTAGPPLTVSMGGTHYPLTSPATSLLGSHGLSQHGTPQQAVAMQPPHHTQQATQQALSSSTGAQQLSSGPGAIDFKVSGGHPTSAHMTAAPPNGPPHPSIGHPISQPQHLPGIPSLEQPMTTMTMSVDAFPGQPAPQLMDINPFAMPNLRYPPNFMQPTVYLPPNATHISSVGPGVGPISSQSDDSLSASGISSVSHHPTLHHQLVVPPPSLLTSGSYSSQGLQAIALQGPRGPMQQYQPRPAAFRRESNGFPNPPRNGPAPVAFDPRFNAHPGFDPVNINASDLNRSDSIDSSKPEFRPGQAVSAGSGHRGGNRNDGQRSARSRNYEENPVSVGTSSSGPYSQGGMMPSPRSHGVGLGTASINQLAPAQLVPSQPRSGRGSTGSLEGQFEGTAANSSGRNTSSSNYYSSSAANQRPPRHRRDDGTGSSQQRRAAPPSGAPSDRSDRPDRSERPERDRDRDRAAFSNAPSGVGSSASTTNIGGASSRSGQSGGQSRADREGTRRVRDVGTRGSGGLDHRDTGGASGPAQGGANAGDRKASVAQQSAVESFTLDTSAFPPLQEAQRGAPVGSGGAPPVSANGKMATISSGLGPIGLVPTSTTSVAMNAQPVAKPSPTQHSNAPVQSSQSQSLVPPKSDRPIVGNAGEQRISRESSVASIGESGTGRERSVPSGDRHSGGSASRDVQGSGVKRCGSSGDMAVGSAGTSSDHLTGTAGWGEPAAAHRRNDQPYDTKPERDSRERERDRVAATQSYAQQPSPHMSHGHRRYESPGAPVTAWEEQPSSGSDRERSRAATNEASAATQRDGNHRHTGHAVQSNAPGSNIVVDVHSCAKPKGSGQSAAISPPVSSSAAAATALTYSQIVMKEGAASLVQTQAAPSLNGLSPSSSSTQIPTTVPSTSSWVNSGADAGAASVAAYSKCHSSDNGSSVSPDASTGILYSDAAIDGDPQGGAMGGRASNGSNLVGSGAAEGGSGGSGGAYRSNRGRPSMRSSQRYQSAPNKGHTAANGSEEQ